MCRHNSLSALDVKRYKSRSLPSSPVHIQMSRQQSTPSPTAQSPVPARRTQTSVPAATVTFSVGGEVTTLAKLNITPSINVTDISLSKRNR